MHKPLVTIAAVLGMLAVISGAFGAHALKPHLTADELEIYQTANRYQFIHVLAILFTGLAWRGNKLMAYAGYAFVIGILLFSGSIYLLALREMLGIQSWSMVLGPVTPMGGIFFLVGWGWLAMGALRS